MPPMYLPCFAQQWPVTSCPSLLHRNQPDFIVVYYYCFSTDFLFLVTRSARRSIPSCFINLHGRSHLLNGETARAACSRLKEPCSLWFRKGEQSPTYNPDGSKPTEAESLGILFYLSSQCLHFPLEIKIKIFYSFSLMSLHLYTDFSIEEDAVT